MNSETLITYILELISLLIQADQREQEETLRHLNNYRERPDGGGSQNGTPIVRQYARR